jgi:hypothetical protein
MTGRSQSPACRIHRMAASLTLPYGLPSGGTLLHASLPERQAFMDLRPRGDWLSKRQGKVYDTIASGGVFAPALVERRLEVEGPLHQHRSTAVHASRGLDLRAWCQGLGRWWRGWRDGRHPTRSADDCVDAVSDLAIPEKSGLPTTCCSRTVGTRGDRHAAATTCVWRQTHEAWLVTLARCARPPHRGRRSVETP